MTKVQTASRYLFRGGSAFVTVSFQSSTLMFSSVHWSIFIGFVQISPYFLVSPAQHLFPDSGTKYEECDREGNKALGSHL